MKFFLDTAHVASIKELISTGLINGVTTNPTHLSKEKMAPREVVETICVFLPEGDISVEVTETEPDAVYKQACAIAQIAPNVIVKVPCYKTYYAVIKQLVDEDIPVNVTLVFSVLQGLMMCKLGVRYISPFVGRWNDIDMDGMEIVHELRALIDQYNFDTEILVASVRSVRQVHEAAMAGADVTTMPVDILQKMMDHPLTDQGMELFAQDWKRLHISHFP
ncbi:MAG TPA: transaldolase family protein [Candidatus Bathyarchaeia archaeon]|nr:transaldolase family protein [Candidatus Bathyarchaeia archaeon]